jgi:glutamine amidotransferase PdxT
VCCSKGAWLISHSNVIALFLLPCSLSATQALVGGLDVEVCRNYFGSQVSSFEQGLDTAAINPTGAAHDQAYPAVFIRAPAILAVSHCDFINSDRGQLRA